MSATTGGPDRAELPMGIGKVSLKLVLALAVLGVIFAQGARSYVHQFIHGEIVTNMRTLGAGGAPWGMYIAFVVYFFGVAFAGASVAAMARLFNLPELRPFSRMGLLLTLTSIVLGGSCILADLGDPLNGLMNLPRYARISSPFFGTFTLVVGGFLFPSLVLLYLTGRADAAALLPRAKGWLLRSVYTTWASGFKGSPGEVYRHHRATFWLCLALLASMVTEKSTLGLVFGIQGGRPGWYGALQAPSFLVLGAISGIGVLMIMAALVRWALDLGEGIPAKGFRLLGNFTWVLILVYLYFMVIEEVTSSYAAAAADSRVAHEVLLGTYAPVFWTVVVTLVLPLLLLFVQFVRGTASVGLGVFAGVLVNVAAILKRYLIVVPSQTHGLMLPYEVGHYVPSFIEVSVLLGLLALGAIVMILFAKLFPIVPLSWPEPPAVAPADPGGRSVSRGFAFVLTLFLGAGCAVVGLAASARVGTSPDADPVLPLAPVYFILGLMLFWYSAVVYELFPSARRQEPPPAGGQPAAPSAG